MHLTARTTKTRARLDVVATFLSLAIILSVGLFHFEARADNTPTFEQFVPIGIPASSTFKGYESHVSRDLVRYYATSDPSADSHTALVFIPGSGCDGAFWIGQNGKANAGPEVFALPFKNRTRIVVLDQPGIPRQFASHERGVAEGCPNEYVERDNFDSILSAYKKELSHFLSSQNQAIERLMFVGSSDGTLFALAMAGLFPETRLVLSISGFGPPQPILQLSPAFEQAEKSGAGIQQVLDEWRVIEKSADKQKFLGGHPHQRWATTGTRSSIDEALRLRPDITLFLAQGGHDQSWPPAAFASGIATLVANKRDFLVRYIPCAEHTLICAEDGGEPKRLQATVKAAAELFLDGKNPEGDVAAFTLAD
ncbi:MAG: hypothetical protein H7315_09845 [Herminiimonas sp.]|nr:hypothetical protein [Herminiimonas sp.]